MLAYVAQYRLDPFILINRSDASLQFGQFCNLTIVKACGFTNQLTIAFVGKTHDDFRIGIADRGHIQQTWRLIHNDESLAISTHLGNGVGNHLHRLGCNSSVHLAKRCLTITQ